MNYRTGHALVVIVVLLAIGAGDAMARSIEDRKWIRMESQNFTVHSAVSQSKTRELLLHLEAMFTVFPALARRADELIPTTVTIVSDEADMAALGIDADLVAGLFTSGLRRNRMLIRYQGHREDVETVLHEFVHYLVFNLVRFPFPNWYTEGYADYVSSSEIRKDRFNWGLPNEGRIRTLVRYDWIPMRELMGSREIWSGKDKQRMLQAYAQSWLLVHYLYSRPAAVNAIGSELQRYGSLRLQGADELAAFEGAFDIKIDELDDLLRGYLNRTRKYAISAAYITDLKRNFDPQSSRMTRAETATVLAEYLLPDFTAAAYLDDSEAEVARRLIDIALTDDSTRARATACLARLHKYEQNHDAAGQAISTAAEMATGNIGIQLDAYRFFRTRATQGDAAAAEQADQYLLRAAALDAQNPEYRLLKGQSLLDREAYADGLQLIELAARQARAAFEVQTSLAVAYARAGRKSEALQMANELLLYGHVSEDIATFARDLIRQLEDN